MFTCITRIQGWQNGQQVHTPTPCAEKGICQPAVAAKRMNKGNEDTLPS
jgi:hypothetical protein